MDPNFTLAQNYFPLVILAIIGCMVAIPLICSGNYSRKTSMTLGIGLMIVLAIACAATGSWGGLLGVAALAIGFAIRCKRTS
jgi:uncharacterized membrane protein